MPTVAELKSRLKALGLNTNGRKNDLLQRLNDHMNSARSSSSCDNNNNTKKRGRDEGGWQGSTVSGNDNNKRVKVNLKELEHEIQKSFEMYADDEDVNMIKPEGMVKLCSDLGVDPEDPIMLSLSYLMNAKNLGEYSRDEYVAGLTKLKVTSIKAIQDHEKQVLRNLLNPKSPDFLALYKFAYQWACEPNQKSIGKDMALTLWPILLKPLNFPLLDQFLQFASKHVGKGVSKDLWVQFHQFIVQYTASSNPNPLQDHDSDSGAWPVLIDDFVDEMRKK